MNFQAVIGLEIHVQLKTKSKMFSSSRCGFGERPNTSVSSLDMAFPGAMPSVNKQAVIYAIRVCHALKMDIDNELWFDRKNYFYTDLPKGYQITQHRRPIGTNGVVTIKTSSGKKDIHISALQIEEDAGKQIHYKDKTLVDYNRAGIPLIEIVSKPEFNDGEEAMKYVEKIRSIVSFLDVSDGKMEEGSLRCDINVSLKPYGSEKKGTKVEIKNVNTLLNLKKAIDYEIKRQERILLSGKRVPSETRRYDENKKETVLMRIKTIDADYKYFTEPNIAPIRLSQEFIDSAIKTSNELADQKYERYLSLGLNEYDATLLTNNRDMCLYFEEMVKENANPKLCANWINGKVLEVLNKREISIKEFPISPSSLAELIVFTQKGVISNKQAREIFDKMLLEGKKPSDYLNDSEASLINDVEIISNHIAKVIEENPSIIYDYKRGKDKAVGFVVGQVMKNTKGRANPNLTNQLIIKMLKEK